jgi:hypothetical protein
VNDTESGLPAILQAVRLQGARLLSVSRLALPRRVWEPAAVLEDAADEERMQSGFFVRDELDPRAIARWGDVNPNARVSLRGVAARSLLRAVVSVVVFHPYSVGPPRRTARTDRPGGSAR